MAPTNNVSSCRLAALPQLLDDRDYGQAQQRSASECRACREDGIGGQAAVECLEEADAHRDESREQHHDQEPGLALVGAYLLAGELAAAGWDPDAGFARYEARMRPFVEANQEIGRLNARSRDVPGSDAEPRPDFASEWFTELVGRAINGIQLPDYTGMPDSAALAGSPMTSSAKP